MGVKQSVSSLLRALGPFMVGMMASAGVAIKFPFFGFWILGVLYFCCFLFLFWMSPLERFRVGDTSAALADLKSKAVQGARPRIGHSSGPVAPRANDECPLGPI